MFGFRTGLLKKDFLKFEKSKKINNQNHFWFWEVVLKKSILGAAVALVLLGGAASANQIKLSGKSGESEFGSIQAAIDSIKDAGEYTIKLSPGTYNEVLYYNGPATIKLSGDTQQRRGADVVISEANDGDLYKQKRAKSQQNGRCIFEFEGTGNLILENLTMENTYSRLTGKGSNTQAETIGFDSTGTLAAYNCTFKSHQDTLRTTGKSWFYDCYIEGDTDFIWMEAKGVVALFENCDIRALYDEKPGTSAIIGAPRMNYGPKSGKGLVFLNCSVSSEKPEMTFLGRTPWNSGYYNQIAYINTKIPDVSPKLWQGEPLMENGVDRTVIGWKLDQATFDTVKSKGSKEGNNTASSGMQTILFILYGGNINKVNVGGSSSASSASSGRNDILKKSQVQAEFSGRRAILNRIFDHARNDYRRDYETYWNIDDFISNCAWNVAQDNSKELVNGEKLAEFIEYDFSKGIPSGTELSVKGFEAGSSASGEVPYVIGDNGAEISFPVKSKGVVTVYGLFEGKATVKMDGQGESLLNFANGSKTNLVASSYVVYNENGTVTIKANSPTRIAKIVYETDPQVKFVPVTSVKVSPVEEIPALKARKKTQFQVSWKPVMASNRDFIWSVSDESLATVNEFGLVTAKDVSEDCTVNVVATSRDSKKASGVYKLKILKANPKEFEVAWLNDLDASASPFPGTSDNAKVMTVSNAKPSDSHWTLNSSKFNATFSDGGISYEGYSSAIAGTKTAFVDFPMTAQQELDIKSIIVSFGNHGTSNVGALFTIIRASGEEEIMDDTSRKCRSCKRVYDDEGLLDTIHVNAGETITLRISLYGVDGNGETTIAKGKAPTIGTVSISGLAK